MSAARRTEPAPSPSRPRPRQRLTAARPRGGWPFAVLRRRSALEVALTVGACVVVWIWRRPEQLTRPYVWVEESHILRNYLTEGWTSVFDPIQGYLILPASVLVTLAAKISFVHLPGLMYVFALGVFVATILLLVVPDSRWGDRTTRSAMALTASLVPTNPEVFGVLLYSFWWTTLWPLVVLGWKRSLWALRAPALAVGALSSPAGGALFVLFAFAYAQGRRARDAISAGILFAGFVVQVVLTLTSSRAESLTTNATPRNIIQQSLRTGGFYETNWLAPGNPDRGFITFSGLLVLAFFLAAGVYVSVAAKRDEALLMSLAAFGFTVFSAIPAPLKTDPIGGGPRYLFLPFVAFGWTLLLLLRHSPTRRLAAAAGVLLCASLLSLATTFSRPPESIVANLSWRDELAKCGRSPASVVPVPIYFDGSMQLFWSLDLTPAQCRALST